jgi:hypothetical protein
MRYVYYVGTTNQRRAARRVIVMIVFWFRTGFTGTVPVLSVIVGVYGVCGVWRCSLSRARVVGDIREPMKSRQ